MTQLAVLRNRDTVSRLVRLVVAAETSGRHRMSNLIRIRAPANLHGGKNIAPINGLRDTDGLAQVGLLEGIGQPRVGRVTKGALDLSDRHLMTRVRRHQRANGVTTDERNLGVDAAFADGGVYRPFRRGSEAVRRTVVAIEAIHASAGFAGQIGH